MAKQKKAHHRLDPEDVLEGRARPNARELLALIHDVNPSGHDLPAKENARRYAQKSRLQSLLVRRFPDEIVVEPGDEPGVVGLRHRTSGVDACHAVLASLDDDARSWVLFQLDVGGDEEEESAPLTALPEEPEPSGPPSGAPLDELSTEELVRRGRAALKAYDYDAARERFSAAVDRGNREAGPLLLAVLAEHLGLDEDALGLEARLDAETLRRADVRLLLAQAAGRSYERERAIRLVKAETGDAAAEVFAALARGALARGELDHAAHDVAEIERRAPSHPALLGLAETVKKRRAEERAPVEAEAQRVFDEGRFEEAEAQAAALAARWPESTVAHSIARGCQEQRRREEARRLAAEGHDALQKGEGARALGLLRRAMTIGLRGDDGARAESDLYRAEAMDRARIEREKAFDVARLLREGHVLRGLTDYVALDDLRRNDVKSGVPLSELVYLDETGVAGTGPDAKAAAQAVMALTRAIAMSSTDPSGAVDLLTPYMPLLERVPTAVQAMDVASELRKLRAQIVASQAMTAAMSAISKANGQSREAVVRSLELYGQVRRADLDEPGQRRLDRLTARTRRLLERWDRSVEVGKLRKAEDFVGARDALDALIRFEEAGREIDAPETPTEPDMSSLAFWIEQRAEVVRDLATVADVHAYGPPADDCLLGAEAPPLLDVPESVLPGGHEIVLAEAHAGLVFFQILDAASGRATRRARLRMKSPFEVGRIHQHAGRAALTGAPGMYLEVDVHDWEIGTGIAVYAGAEPAQQAVLAPGGRFVWGTTVMDDWWTALSVQDVEGDAKGKSFAESVLRLTVRPLLGLPEPRVVVVRDKGLLTVYEAKGAHFGTTHEGIAALQRSVVVHPGGKGLFALICEGKEEPRSVHWAELAADGTPLRAPAGEDRTIEGLDPDAPCETAVGLDARVVFVLGWTRDAAGARVARRLVGFEARGAGLDRCFDVEVPPRVTLAHDGAARTVVALSPHEQGIEVVRLDASPPRFHAVPPAAPPLDLAGVNLTPTGACAPRDLHLWTFGVEETGQKLGIEYFQHVKADERRETIAGVLGPEDRAHIVPRYAALAKVPKPGFAEDFAAMALARYPGDPELEQIPAQRAAVAGDWAAVRDRLSPIDPAALGDAPAQHHDHLLGTALLMTGDVEGARRVLLRGAARAQGWCDLSLPLTLVGEGRPGIAAVQELDRAARAADARLAAGDASGARRALSGLVVRESREVQTLARLCRAWLAEPEDGPDGFAKRLALTVFVVAHEEKRPMLRRELPFAGARWDGATLDALAAEAAKWLDDDMRKPRPGAKRARPTEPEAEAPGPSGSEPATPALVCVKD